VNRFARDLPRTRLSAQPQEYEGVDEDRRENADEYPEVMQPETLVGVYIIDPTL
jgi:hypothetical protein